MHRNLRWLPLLGAVLALPLAVWGDEPPGIGAGPTSDQMTTWVRELDARKFAEREHATAQLLAAGAAALPHLEAPLHGESLEAADRSAWILEQLAESGEAPVELHALELLVTCERFPGIARRADVALAELQEFLCREHLRQLGAEFDVEPERQTPRGVTSFVKVNINHDAWTGELADLETLSKLRQVSTLKLAARGLDDDMARKLAEIKDLRLLELIETDVTPGLVEELKKEKPELRLRLKGRAMLGIALNDNGGPPTVSQVYPNTPAAEAGFQAGDAVLEFGGQQVRDFDSLTTSISQHEPGERVKVVVERELEEVELTATLVATDWSGDSPLGGR